MDNKILVFGYGSLMNKKSFLKTCATARDFRQCFIKDYKRVFNLKASRTFENDGRAISVLNIEESKGIELPGISTYIDEGDLVFLRKREDIYEEIEVEIYFDDGIALNGITYIAKGEDYKMIENSSKQSRYISLCFYHLKEIFGVDFFENVLKTTYNGDKNLLELYNLGKINFFEVRL